MTLVGFQDEETTLVNNQRNKRLNDLTCKMLQKYSARLQCIRGKWSSSLLNLLASFRMSTALDRFSCELKTIIRSVNLKVNIFPNIMDK